MFFSLDEAVTPYFQSKVHLLSSCVEVFFFFPQCLTPSFHVEGILSLMQSWGGASIFCITTLLGTFFCFRNYRLEDAKNVLNNLEEAASVHDAIVRMILFVDLFPC